jgi:hypothetical protein
MLMKIMMSDTTTSITIALDELKMIAITDDDDVKRSWTIRMNRLRLDQEIVVVPSALDQTTVAKQSCNRSADNSVEVALKIASIAPPPLHTARCILADDKHKATLVVTN